MQKLLITEGSKNGKTVLLLFNMPPNQYNYHILERSNTKQLLVHKKWNSKQSIHFGPNNNYFFFDPWEVDFSLPAGVNRTIIHGFFPDAQLVGSTCEWAAALDVDNHCIVSPFNKYWHNNNTHDCHYLDTILLYITESYQAGTLTTYKQVFSRKIKSVILLCCHM